MKDWHVFSYLCNEEGVRINVLGGGSLICCHSAEIGWRHKTGTALWSYRYRKLGLYGNLVHFILCCASVWACWQAGVSVWACWQAGFSRQGRQSFIRHNSFCLMVLPAARSLQMNEPWLFTGFTKLNRSTADETETIFITICWKRTKTSSVLTALKNMQSFFCPIQK